MNIADHHITKFWGKITKSNFCWVWRGLVTKDGYGRISIYGKTVLTHRLSWVLHFGEIPKELGVLHKCDNPSCVNPDHLFLGTFQENMRDKINKKRHTFGSIVEQSDLTERDILEIRRRYESRSSGSNGSKSLSKEFNISQVSINDIVTRKTWKHI